MSVKTHFEVLGVSMASTDEEVRHAFRVKARKLHPDYNPSQKAAGQFAELRAAYESIRLEADRIRYREGLLRSVDLNRNVVLETWESVLQKWIGETKC